MDYFSPVNRGINTGAKKSACKLFMWVLSIMETENVL